jgi:hypothetical protein
MEVANRKFASTFDNRDNDFFVKVSDPVEAQGAATLKPVMLLYNVQYLSSTATALNEIVQNNYKQLSLYPAFWEVGKGAQTPFFFKVSGGLSATDSKKVVFGVEADGLTFLPVVGGVED